MPTDIEWQSRWTGKSNDECTPQQVRDHVAAAVGTILERSSRCLNRCLVTGAMAFCLANQAIAGDDPVAQSNAAFLGTVEFPISCTAAVQPQFNRAVTLLHHMTYPQAREAFEQVAKADPKCAMAHWGIAMTLFQPLWPTRPGPEELQRGWEEVLKAKALEPPTERERLFLAAAEAFFREPTAPDYWERIRRWEQAMEKVHSAFPKDSEAAAFYALAHLATAPANTISRTHADLAAKLVLGVLKQNPNHAGAMHYLVHANDVPGREQEEFEVVCGYEKVAPRNPHALHMPTHIYTRLGEWERVIRGNLLAAEAALEHPARNGQFVWDEFPHAIEYLIYAYLQKGDDDQAAAQLKRLRGTPRLEPTFKTAFHTASTQARYALERRAWSEAMSLAPREPSTLDWDPFPWPEAVTWFARGLAAAHQGEIGVGQRSIRRLQELETVAAKSGEELFMRNIRVLRLEVQAWLAHAMRDHESSIKLMREATELEGSTPKHAVTPAPTLPAGELLGDLLLEQKQPTEALAAYRQSLRLYPKRFNTLLGAARAARATRDDVSAEAFYRVLLEIAGDGNRLLALQEARAFVEHRR
jgi:tetratricopeptide (TPR) repeat protein